jgi:predicted nucleotidyltransferase
MPKSIVLFGSYSRGEDIESSDIDIFVECKKEQVNIIKFNKKLKRNIEIRFKENFNKYPKELKNNIINGIILSGFLEGYK